MITHKNNWHVVVLAFISPFFFFGCGGDSQTAKAPKGLYAAPVAISEESLLPMAPDTPTLEPSGKAYYDPQYAEVLSSRAKLLLAEGRGEEAKMILEKAKELDPTNTTIDASLKEAKLIIGKHRQTKENDPEYSQVLVQQGTLFLEKDKYDEAMKLFQKAIEVDPKNRVAARQIENTREYLEKKNEQQQVLGEESIPWF